MNAKLQDVYPFFETFSARRTGNAFHAMIDSSHPPNYGPCIGRKNNLGSSHKVLLYVSLEVEDLRKTVEESFLPTKHFLQPLRIFSPIDRQV